jgi:serine/threonine-protein kinase HipA
MPSAKTRAYVYLQLPESLEVVTAGYYELDERDGVPVGTFVYNPRYVARADAVPLEPFELPLRAGRFETVKLNGIFGTLRDASPDAWGRRIIERHLGRVDLTEIDYLLHSPEDRAGALSFGRGKEPPGPNALFNQVLSLPALVEHAERLAEAFENPEAYDVQAQQIADLVQPGTSLGGARPKNVVEDEEGLWVAKFPAKEDKWNHPRVEAAMLNLAAECGIGTAHHRVVTVAGRDVLLVKRFDRAKTQGGYLRFRMVSGLTVLGAEDTYRARGKWSYLELADEVRRRSFRPNDDLEELFRRMAFNALISNTDDHPRNHAMIAPGREFRLSPAYDLTPVPQVSREKRDLALTIGKYNRYANRANLLSEHGRFRLSLDEAAAIVDHVQQVVVTRWRPVMRELGVTDAECDLLAGAFNYPGFELNPETVLAY